MRARRSLRHITEPDPVSYIQLFMPPSVYKAGGGIFMKQTVKTAFALFFAAFTPDSLHIFIAPSFMP